MMYFDEKTGELKDNEIVAAIRKAADDYEDGAILEASYVLEKIVDAIRRDAIRRWDEVEDEREHQNIVEDLSLEELEFTVRTYNRLHKLGVRKLSDIVNIPESTFYNIDGFGKRSQEEVLGKLHWLGYTMKWEGLE